MAQPGPDPGKPPLISYPQAASLNVKFPCSEEDPAGEPIIPTIQSLAPCIFVPLAADEDLSAPFTSPTTRLAELHDTLALIDSHSAAVRTNLLNLFTRDAARIRQEARRQEAHLHEVGAHPGDTEPGIGRQETADMIANMEQPQEAGKDYNLDTIPQPDFVTNVVLHNPREWASNCMFRLGTMAATDLEGYERHVTELRAHYEQEIKKEMDRQPG